MKNFVIGVDVGGTNVKLGIVNAQGQVIVRSSFMTKQFMKTPQTLMIAIADAITTLLESADLSKKDIIGVGVGLPGLIDVAKGIVRILPNIPGWIDVPFKETMEHRLDIPVFIENDVNMITLGEWQYGAGKGINNLICITLGTGVGAGLILNNDIYRGAGFAAGEIGHVPLEFHGPLCGCGGSGCFERYVGNQSLHEKAIKTFQDKDITLEEVYYFAVEGHKKALKFWDEVGELVGIGLTGVVNILNPDCIIIGGGIAGSFDFLRSAIRRTIDKRAMKVQSAMVEIIKARLDGDAGLIGAKVLVCHEK